MTVSLNLANVANAISNISVTGVTVKDKDEIAGSWIPLPNVLYPKPDDWITGFSMTWDALMQGSTAPMTISYTLNYRFLGVQIGDISAFPASYSALVDKLILIINAIISTPAPYSGKIEMQITGVSIGPRTDPAGNNFFGADFAVSISEMQN
jgi:hypothetical protein